MEQKIKKEQLEDETRGVFHKIHLEQAADKEIFNRTVSLLSEEYFKVEKGFFKNKTCLDAGCGSNARATYAMLQMGAKKVHCFDLDKSVFEKAPQFLSKFESSRYELTTDNVLHMKYSDNFFDFVHCAGVLHHTFDVFKGLKDLARVTKKGGILYIMVYGKGGIAKDITNALRQKYHESTEFKSFIDTLTPELFHQMLEFILIVMKKKNDAAYKDVDFDKIKRLFDKDLVLTIKDRIQAPSYTEATEKEITDWLKNNGFHTIERLTLYPKYNNIRKFLSPFYYKYDSKFSRLIYGEGMIQIKAIKN